jgi:hypothetical protein
MWRSPPPRDCGTLDRRLTRATTRCGSRKSRSRMTACRFGHFAWSSVATQTVRRSARRRTIFMRAARTLRQSATCRAGSQRAGTDEHGRRRHVDWRAARGRLGRVSLQQRESGIGEVATPTSRARSSQWSSSNALPDPTRRLCLRGPAITSSRWLPYWRSERRSEGRGDGCKGRTAAGCPSGRHDGNERELAGGVACSRESRLCVRGGLLELVKTVGPTAPVKFTARLGLEGTLSQEDLRRLAEVPETTARRTQIPTTSRTYS